MTNANSLQKFVNTLPGPRDLQPQRKGTSLQAANLFGAVGGEIYIVSSFALALGNPVLKSRHSLTLHLEGFVSNLPPSGGQQDLPWYLEAKRRDLI